MLIIWIFYGAIKNLRSAHGSTRSASKMLARQIVVAFIGISLHACLRTVGIKKKTVYNKIAVRNWRKLSLHKLHAQTATGSTVFVFSKTAARQAIMLPTKHIFRQIKSDDWITSIGRWIWRSGGRRRLSMGEEDDTRKALKAEWALIRKKVPNFSSIGLSELIWS